VTLVGATFPPGPATLVVAIPRRRYSPCRRASSAVPVPVGRLDRRAQVGRRHRPPSLPRALRPLDCPTGVGRARGIVGRGNQLDAPGPYNHISSSPTSTLTAAPGAPSWTAGSPRSISRRTVRGETRRGAGQGPGPFGPMPRLPDSNRFAVSEAWKRTRRGAESDAAGLRPYRRPAGVTKATSKGLSEGRHPRAAGGVVPHPRCAPCRGPGREVGCAYVLG